MLGYKQMKRSSSFRLASEGKVMVLLSENFTYPLIYRDHRKKICARGMPKTSVGIIV